MDRSKRETAPVSEGEVGERGRERVREIQRQRVQLYGTELCDKCSVCFCC